MINKTILDCSAEEARAFFMKASSYCNIDLPKYFDFQKLLDRCSEIADVYKYEEVLFNYKKGQKNTKNDDKSRYANNIPDVNYLFYQNKDGRFSWRPMRIINPIVYAYLVKDMTDTNNWAKLLNRLRRFQSEHILCLSLPIINNDVNRTDQETIILNWWQQIEQQSIELSLDYNYLLITDITDCYGSIYTHIISWAVESQKIVREYLLKGWDEQNKLLGIRIDKKIQTMSYQQTNGIPQGSVLMDFIAELVLGYADHKLAKRIDEFCENNHRSIDYKILRYRDDYRIFGKTQEDVVLIAKILTEVLSELNFKLNTQKTFISQDIIRDSIKPDKLYWNSIKNTETTFQKRLLIIHELSQKHPNSGSLVKALDRFYRDFHSLDILKEPASTKVLTSIIVDIIYHNPKTYKIGVAILSKLFALEPNRDIVDGLFKKILDKFSHLPNVGYMYVWLQRLTLNWNNDNKKTYNEKLCELVDGNDVSLWNNTWLKDDLANELKKVPIVNMELMKDLSMVIEPNEVLTFNVY